jgi:starch phosphorylase
VRLDIEAFDEPFRDRVVWVRHLADLGGICPRPGARRELYASPDAWVRKAILNVAHSHRFSSDRTIREYAAEIWNAKPCPVD